MVLRVILVGIFLTLSIVFSSVQSLSNFGERAALTKAVMVVGLGCFVLRSPGQQGRISATGRDLAK
jgi:hypothetical protein